MKDWTNRILYIGIGILVILWLGYCCYIDFIDSREKKMEQDIEAEKKAFYLKEAR